VKPTHVYREQPVGRYSFICSQVFRVDFLLHRLRHDTRALSDSTSAHHVGACLRIRKDRRNHCIVYHLQWQIRQRAHHWSCNHPGDGSRDHITEDSQRSSSKEHRRGAGNEKRDSETEKEQKQRWEDQRWGIVWVSTTEEVSRRSLIWSCTVKIYFSFLMLLLFSLKRNL